MASYDMVLENQLTIEANLLKKLSEFESLLKPSAPHTSTSTLSLLEEFQEFKAQVWSIMSLLRQQISECTKSIEIIEMRHRRKYLLFHGVSEDTAGSLSDYFAGLFAKKLGLQNFTSDALKVCHRLGKITEGKCRPILVRFSDPLLRSTVWRKKVCFKGTSVVVSEFLTRQRQSLFLLARKRLGIRNCWTADGNIFIKTQDGTRHRIGCEEDLSIFTDTANKQSASAEKSSKCQPTPLMATAPSEQHLRTKRTVRAKK